MTRCCCPFLCLNMELRTGHFSQDSIKAEQCSNWLMSGPLLSISCRLCQVHQSLIYTMINAGQAQAGNAALRPSPVTIQWGLWPIPVCAPSSDHMMTMLHWHLIITTSSVSLLCNSPLLCTVAWGRKEASRISERYWKMFSQKHRVSLDWTELIVYWQYWII